MLPKKLIKNVIKRPGKRDSDEGIKEIEDYKSMGYSDKYIETAIISIEDAEQALKNMEINQKTIIYQYYLNGFDSMKYEIIDDRLYGISEILENYNQPFWSNEYPDIEKRYLQLSSIEGEYSYFYDKETDYLYGVDWGEMDDFMAGKLKPLFTSFYDFLEWYYSEEEEN